MEGKGPAGINGIPRNVLTCHRKNRHFQLSGSGIPGSQFPVSGMGQAFPDIPGQWSDNLGQVRFVNDRKKLNGGSVSWSR
jgi:hypothetical protein